MKKVTISKNQIETVLGMKLLGVKMQGGLVGGEQADIGFFAYPECFDFIVPDCNVENLENKGGRDGEEN